QAFLHRTVQQLVVSHNTLAHSRFGQDVLKQSCNGRCGRVVATEHEGLHDAGDELRVYRFAVDLAVGQRGEEVVGRLLLTLVELGLHECNEGLQMIRKVWPSDAGECGHRYPADCHRVVVVETDHTADDDGRQDLGKLSCQVGRSCSGEAIDQ